MDGFSIAVSTNEHELFTCRLDDIWVRSDIKLFGPSICSGAKSAQTYAPLREQMYLGLGWSLKLLEETEVHKATV
jgi:hypothetical protein